MIRFFLRRFLAVIVTLFVVSILVFAAGRLTGDPRYQLLSDNATPEQWEALGVQLGLDKPLPIQYFTYIGQMLTGDMGTSITLRQPVAALIADRFSNTVQLALTAFTFAVIVGLVMGIVSGSRRGGWVTKVAKVMALTGQALPTFWLGIMLIFAFAVGLGWFPVSGNREPHSVVLPAFALGWHILATFLRLTHSSMLDVMDSDYITMARARGLSNRAVVWRHAARNALLAPITLMGVTLGSLITGSLVTETVFAWPGMGKLAIDAVMSSDYPVLQGTVIVFTALYMSASLLVDLLYSVIDPRIRLFEPK